jgi:hypothetical protein
MPLSLGAHCGPETGQAYTGPIIQIDQPFIENSPQIARIHPNFLYPRSSAFICG